MNLSRVSIVVGGERHVNLERRKMKLVQENWGTSFVSSISVI